jgi:hypothetical protein
MLKLQLNKWFQRSLNKSLQTTDAKWRQYLTRVDDDHAYQIMTSRTTLFFLSLFLWKTSWLLSNATKECEVANFHGKASDVYAYVWMVQGSFFSWITLWNLCHTLNRCKVAYIHGTLHDSHSMQWRKVR